jgi:hypothetical protein
MLSESTIFPGTHRVGPFDVSGDSGTLTLRFENHGGISFRLAVLFVVSMVFVLALALLTIADAVVTAPTAHHAYIAGLDRPERILEPADNHFGYLWLISAAAMIIAVPLCVRKAYQAALVFTFRRSDDAFLRGDYLITRLRKIECVRIHEILDPDDRYLYQLDIIYGDGREVQMYEGYEERDALNLGNEISAFVSVPLSWK